MPFKIDEPEEAQLRQCLTLLEQLLYERATEAEKRLNSGPVHLARLAAYRLEDFLNAATKPTNKD